MPPAPAAAGKNSSGAVWQNKPAHGLAYAFNFSDKKSMVRFQASPAASG